MIDWAAVIGRLREHAPALAACVEGDLREWAQGAPPGVVFGSPRRWALARRDALLIEYAALLPDASLAELASIAARFVSVVLPRYRRAGGPPETVSAVHAILWEASCFADLPDSARQWRRILGDRARCRRKDYPGSDVSGGGYVTGKPTH